MGGGKKKALHRGYDAEVMKMRGIPTISLLAAGLALGWTARADSDAPAPEAVDLLAYSEALADLSDNERVAFVLRHYEDRSIREIAASMKTPVGSVKNHLFRAVRKLRTALSESWGAMP